MIGYVTIGAKDKEKALAFFDELLGLIGGKRAFANDRLQFYAGNGAMLGVGDPYDGKPATAGNGVMVALTAESREKVDEVYAKALELGGADEGAPGERMQGFYGGYFRDLDGNKFVVFKMG